MTRPKDKDNQPLPANHPFKGGLIIFGAKRPGSSENPSTPREKSSFNPEMPEEIKEWMSKGIYEVTAHQMSDESGSSTSPKEKG